MIKTCAGVNVYLIKSENISEFENLNYKKDECYNEHNISVRCNTNHAVNFGEVIEKAVEEVHQEFTLIK